MCLHGSIRFGGIFALPARTQHKRTHSPYAAIDPRSRQQHWPTAPRDVSAKCFGSFCRPRTKTETFSFRSVSSFSPQISPGEFFPFAAPRAPSEHAPARPQYFAENSARSRTRSRIRTPITMFINRNLVRAGKQHVSGENTR